MPVCPVCFASTSHEDRICSDCGADLSLPPDEARNSLETATSPFSAYVSSGITTDSKPVRCKACDSENFTSARFCEKCSQSLYQTTTPPKKRRKLVLLLIIAVLALIVFFTVVYIGISYIWYQIIHHASYSYETEASLPEEEYMEVSYDDYAVRPDGVFGDNVKITGYVYQIMNEHEKDSLFLSIYICEDSETLKIWKVGYNLKEDEDIVVGDILTVYGTSHGLAKEQFKDTGKTVYFPVIRASVVTRDDAISGKTWSVEGSSIFYLREDGTCTVVFGQGEEEEFSDTGTYRVYRGISAINYVETELEELGLSEEEQVSSFDLQEESVNDYYCLVLFRDKDVQEGDNSVPLPTLFYIGLYYEESSSLGMISSTSLSFVTLTEVTE